MSAVLPAQRPVTTPATVARTITALKDVTAQRVHIFTTVHVLYRRTVHASTVDRNTHQDPRSDSTVTDGKIKKVQLFILIIIFILIISYRIVCIYMF